MLIVHCITYQLITLHVFLQASPQIAEAAPTPTFIGLEIDVPAGSQGNKLRVSTKRKRHPSSDEDKEKQNKKANNKPSPKKLPNEDLRDNCSTPPSIPGTSCPVVEIDDCIFTSQESRPHLPFNPLTNVQRTAMCQQLGLAIKKKHHEHTTRGCSLSGLPVVRRIAGDGNCLFRALSVATTGWEGPHERLRSSICNYIEEHGTYLGEDGPEYLAVTHMWKDTVHGTDVELMAAASMLGCDIYVFYKYGHNHRWLRFPCQHECRLEENAIYLDNRKGDGRSGHYTFVMNIKQ